MTHALAAPDLWSAARAMLSQLLHLVGLATPAGIARLARGEREELRVWVAGVEAMVRKLLLIEADALGPPAPRRHGSAAQKHNAARAPRSPAFSLVPLAARQPAHPARIRQLGPPLTLRELWRNAERDVRIARLQAAPRAALHVRLANRIAALTRVIAKPLPHARRLARLLAHAASAAFDAIVSAPARRRPTAFQSAAFDQAGAHVRALDRERFVHRR